MASAFRGGWGGVAGEFWGVLENVLGHSGLPLGFLGHVGDILFGSGEPLGSSWLILGGLLGRLGGDLKLRTFGVDYEPFWGVFWGAFRQF